MFQTKVVEKIKTHILYSVNFSENRTLYEIMWKNTVERDGPQMAIWRMRVQYRIIKTTNTHSQYVILIAFFPHCKKMVTRTCLIFTLQEQIMCCF